MRIHKDEEKGAVTLFVLIACLLMLIIVLSINIAMSNKRVNQEKELDAIARTYTINEGNLEDEYVKIAEKNEYPTIGQVEEMIQSKLPVHEKINVTPLDGVQTSSWQIVEKIGHIVIVNMRFSVNTSKLQLSTNANDRTVVIKNFPVPKTGSAYLNSGYTVDGGSDGHIYQPASVLINQKGELTIQVSGGNKVYRSRICNYFKWSVFSGIRKMSHKKEKII